jgi:hypothetical protein
MAQSIGVVCPTPLTTSYISTAAHERLQLTATLSIHPPHSPPPLQKVLVHPSPYTVHHTYLHHHPTMPLYARTEKRLKRKEREDELGITAVKAAMKEAGELEDGDSDSDEGGSISGESSEEEEEEDEDENEMSGEDDGDEDSDEDEEEDGEGGDDEMASEADSEGKFCPTRL